MTPAVLWMRHGNCDDGLCLPGAHARPDNRFTVFAEWRAPHCVLGRTSTQYPPDYLIWRDQRAHELDSALSGGESLRASPRVPAKPSPPPATSPPRTVLC